MPPPFVRKAGQVVHYYYAKLVIAPSAGMAGNFGFIIDRYKALERGEIQMSDYDRELWIKETTPQALCAYCGGPGPLMADHIIPLSLSAPDSVHNLVRCCVACNGSKSDRDLVEWWDDTLLGRLGPAANSLPRVPAGLYLKLCFDWLKINNLLELPARDLYDLLPFRPRPGSSKPSGSSRQGRRPRGPRRS